MMLTNAPLPAAVRASLPLRIVAAVYDLLPLLALWFAAAAIAVVVTGGALDAHRLGDKLLVQGLALALTAVYFTVSWSRGGQTIGMKAWRLRVVRDDGGALRRSQALLRFAVAMASLAAAGLGYWWALIDARQRTWHDMATGTLVVRLE
jgi:uncharacterized RDD family membrane protein YckC